MPFFKKKSPYTHAADYFILIIILSLTAICVRFLSLTDNLLMVAILCVSIGYVIWGVTHHTKRGHLDKKIFLEYAGIALLVDILVYILLA